MQGSHLEFLGSHRLNWYCEIRVQPSSGHLLHFGVDKNQVSPDVDFVERAVAYLGFHKGGH